MQIVIFSDEKLVLPPEVSKFARGNPYKLKIAYLKKYSPRLWKQLQSEYPYLKEKQKKLRAKPRKSKYTSEFALYSKIKKHNKKLTQFIGLKPSVSKRITEFMISKGVDKTKKKLAEEFLSQGLKNVNQKHFKQYKRPRNRKLVMLSGPMKGKKVTVFEQVDIFTEDLMHYVSSSNIAAIGYREKEKKMQIEFISGAVYTFYNIPKRLFTGIMNAGSHGKYFWKHIRRFWGRYPYRRVRFMR